MLLVKVEVMQGRILKRPTKVSLNHFMKVRSYTSKAKVSA